MAVAVFESRRLRFSWYAFVFCAPSSTRIIPRHTVARSRAAPLEREVGRRVGRLMELIRVVVEMLVAVREVRAGDPRRRPAIGKVVLDPDLASAEPSRLDQSSSGVALDARVTGREQPGLRGEPLDVDDLRLGPVPHDHLDDAVDVGLDIVRAEVSS